jgi:hypothetical protein
VATVATVPTAVLAELAATVVRSPATAELVAMAELVASAELVVPVVFQRAVSPLALVELAAQAVLAVSEDLAEMRPLVKTATAAMAETVDVLAMVARAVMAGMPRLLRLVDVAVTAVTAVSVESPELAELVARPVLVEPVARLESMVQTDSKHAAATAETAETASPDRRALLVRQVDAAATVHRQRLALLETAESVGLAATATPV